MSFSVSNPLKNADGSYRGQWTPKLPRRAKSKSMDVLQTDAATKVEGEKAEGEKPVALDEACAPYEPCGAAEQLFYCKDREILIEGPAGTGKSRAVLEKINLLLMKYPRCRALIVRKTRSSLTQSVLATFEQKVLPLNSPIAVGIQRRVRQSYTYPNESELVVGGMDEPIRIMSTDYDVVAAFEATELSESDWEPLTIRTRNGAMPYQQAIADCNPVGPSHWLNQRAIRGKMTRLLSRHKDNPFFFDREKGDWNDRGRAYMESLENLSGHRRLRLLEGKWSAAEGLVYDTFDPDVNVLSVEQCRDMQIVL